MRRQGNHRRSIRRSPEVGGRAADSISLASLKERGQNLILNIFIFVILVNGLEYIELTKPGQEAKDYGFDYLIKSNYVYNFKNNYLKDQISPDLQLVFLDENSYVNSYTKGYWTPRTDLGLTVLNSIKRGAKVVLIDFNFANEAPVTVYNDQIVDDSNKYIEYLQAAAELARQNKASILVPIIAPGTRPPKGYFDLLTRYRDVFRPANFTALRDSQARLVRRFAWFEYGGDYAPVLSANLFSYLLLRYDASPGAQREAKAALVGAERVGD